MGGEVEGDGKDDERWWQQLVDLSGVDLLSIVMCLDDPLVPIRGKT